MKKVTIIAIIPLLPLLLVAQVEHQNLASNTTQMVQVQQQEDLSWVDEQVAAIKPPRKGLNRTLLASVKDPFATQLRLNQPPKEPVAEDKKPKVAGEKIAFKPASEPALKPLTLQTIMNRSVVQIDGKWYRQNDKIYGYTITSIEDASVLLQRKKKQVRLSLVSKNDKIQINAK